MSRLPYTPEELKDVLFRIDVPAKDEEGNYTRFVPIVTPYDKLPNETKAWLTSDDLPIAFRASSVANLLAGGNEITEKQLETLQALRLRRVNAWKEAKRVRALAETYNARLEGLLAGQKAEEEAIAAEEDKEELKKLKEGLKQTKAEVQELKKQITANKPKVSPLTDKMESDLQELTEKARAPFEFGKTALTLIEDTWLRKEYGYDEPIESDETLKGKLCEQDSIGLVARVISGSFRRKNTTNYRDVEGYFSGTPDVLPVGEDVVEDVKTCWTLRTFVRANPPETYYAQAQVYMYLTGRSKYRLIYCAVDTPEQIINKLKERAYFRYGADDQNLDYLEACAKIDLTHKISPKIPDEDRVKVFRYDFDPEYIERLKQRIRYAQPVYNNLALVPEELKA